MAARLEAIPVDLRIALAWLVDENAPFNGLLEMTLQPQRVSRVHRVARFKKDRSFLTPHFLMGRLKAWAKRRKQCNQRGHSE